MSETYDYGTDAAEQTSDVTLEDLQGLAKNFLEARALVAKKEEELKEAQAQERNLAEHQIPEAMEALGLSEFKTKTGFLFKLEEKIRASIPKKFSAQAFSWLEENGFGGLVKRKFVIAFGKDDEAWANRFAGDLKRRKRPLDAKQEKAVHPQSLAKFVREQLEEGESIPLELFGVYRQNVVKVEGAK
ncbi:MAG: hypothetical protein CMJ75_18740 [Planctomycetaceae bacterium]|nr:hypothetical protein [Planctomycetaceae bacterium]